MKAQWLEGGAEISVDSLVGNDVYYAQFATSEVAYRTPLDAIKEERGYVQEDIVELNPQTPDLEAICAKYVDEHHHDEDEVRFVLEGSGIFDIRSVDDRWMRIQVHPGDLIVVPQGRHHRFMLTDAKTIRCLRLFKDQSGWVPHYRETAAPASATAEA